MMLDIASFKIVRRFEVLQATAHTPVIFIIGLTETEHLEAVAGSRQQAAWTNDQTHQSVWGLWRAWSSICRAPVTLGVNASGSAGSQHTGCICIRQHHGAVVRYAKTACNRRKVMCEARLCGKPIRRESRSCATGALQRSTRRLLGTASRPDWNCPMARACCICIDPPRSQTVAIG